MSNALDVEKVGKVYDSGPQRVEVLADVSFRLAAGEAMAVTGPSGSGKSTLLHILGTLDQPTSGRVRIGGVDPQTLSEPELAKFRNRTVGFVFQDHHLLPQYTVLENVLIPTRAFPAGRADATARAEELLQRVGLGPRRDHRPAELSGGERQRTSVARALINGPGLLLCDEPTGSLDRATADSVSDLLLELHVEEKNVLVVVTHSLELAGRFERRLEVG